MSMLISHGSILKQTSMINYCFPTTTYYEDLHPLDEIQEGMIDYVGGLDKNYGLDSNLTGDTIGEYRIYDNPIFFWLNDQVSIHCREYLKAIGVDDTEVNLYASKAWPVIVREGGHVETHAHRNSILSVVYYLQVNETGSLCFFNSHSHVKDLPLQFKNENETNSATAFNTPVAKRLMIFPSSLVHAVDTYYGVDSRYSISYDIMVTQRDGSNCEHYITDPSTWGKLK